MAIDRSIRDLIQQARRSAEWADEIAEAAKVELAELEEAFRLRLGEARQKIAVAEAVAVERRKTVTMLESLNVPEDGRTTVVRRGSRGRVVGISPEWRAILS